MERTETASASKTVLVVDDDKMILQLVSGILTRAGFTVLTAGSGEEAMRCSREYEGDLHLLLTNIQMPGMTGIELSTRMNIERPDLCVMLMSGYTAGLLVLNDNWHFLHKPFIPAQLLNLVNGVLSLPGGNLNEHTD